jgi:5-methylcytosine-specific restriction endonuclease McrA
MAWILDLMSGVVQPTAERITLNRFVMENSYITRYLSRVVKDKALAVYHVLFHLSWFETGTGQIATPWAHIGAFVRSEQGNIIDNSTTVKRRLPDLLRHKCISVRSQRGGANEVSVHLPSDIPDCRRLIDQDSAAREPVIQADVRDYYSDPARRLEILKRDGSKCVYCLVDITEDTFVLDHLLPITKGGTNRKSNLVPTCPACNGRKGDGDPVQLLLMNYRNQLLTQQEFIQQRQFIETLLQDDGEIGQ